MKKIWISCCVIFFIVTGVVFVSADPKLTPADKNRFGVKTIIKQFTSAQAAYELLPALAYGRYVIDHIVYNTAAAGGWIYLSESTDVTFPNVYLSETDSEKFPTVNIPFTAGEGVDFNSNIAGSHNIRLEYHTE